MNKGSSSENVRRILGHPPQRIRAVPGHDDVVIFGGESRIEQLDVGRNVVDDENAPGHGS